MLECVHETRAGPNSALSPPGRTPLNTAVVFHSQSGVVFLSDPRVDVQPGQRMFDRMIQVMENTGAGWVYSDSFRHPRIDYQSGSIRDSFDFGAVVAVRGDLFRDETENAWSSLYALRLR